MTWAAVAVAGAAVVGSVVASNSADKASQAQQASAQAGIAEQQRQFDQVRQLLNPYVNAGTGALSAQQNLLGLNGQAAQQTAITGLQNSPTFQAMLKQGQNSILQNASATGGLRGGNTQAALAQFSPNLLAQVIQQQFSNLGGLTSIGQNAAAGVGNAGMQTGSAISGLLQQQGAAQAGAALASGQAWGNAANGIGAGLGMYLGRQNNNPGYTVNEGSGNTYDPNAFGAGNGGDYSDIRLKTDIVLIGKTPRGFNRYSWRWKATGERAEGVIAQEVAAIDPSAVIADADGFLKVDYSKV